MNLLKVQAMQRGGVSEEEVQGMLGEVEKQVLSDRQFRLQQARWCRGGALHPWATPSAPTGAGVWVAGGHHATLTSVAGLGVAGTWTG